MSAEKRPETPVEYEKRMAAPYDFEPECESSNIPAERCDLPGSFGVQCKACGSIIGVLCGAHAGRAEKNMREEPVVAVCEVCGVEGSSADLIEVRSLAGWFR